MLAGRTIKMIVATDMKGAIGYQNTIPWRVRSDMRRFVEITTGHSIIMGRTTFQSFPKGALPHRQNIVLTRNEHLIFEKCEVAQTLKQAVEMCHPDNDVFIIGGAMLYELAFPYVDEIHLSTIICELPQADTHFDLTAIKDEEWECKVYEFVVASEIDEYAHTYEYLIRKRV